MPPLTAKIQTPPIIRIRVRCAKDHLDPWLRRLFVVWAPLPPSGDPAPPPPDPPISYSVALSDAKGNLCRLLNDLDPAPDATLPLFPGIDYRFYFVRHPDASLARQLAEELNADSEQAEKKWGKPRIQKAVLTQTGTDAKKRPITEGVLSVDEDPKAFIQNGSPFYGGWSLFRDMPGTGANVKDSDIQCQPLYDQVRRLQFHLGRLRYPIGNQWQPYSPEPWLSPQQRKPLRATLPPAPLYPNEGVFDTVTWNAVLAFQRDARGGQATLLDPAKPRTPTLSPGNFDPLPAAEDRNLELLESRNFVSETAALASDAQCSIDTSVDTIVEAQTATAIRQWLEKDLRKPGSILICRGPALAWDSWMQQTVAPTMDAFDQELRKYGVAKGLVVNNSLRDTRMSVDRPGRGQIVNSIHKSGFAFDMAMEAYVRPTTRGPLYFVKDPASSAKKVDWIVYAPAAIASIPTGPLPDHIEYVDSITPWKYDADSPDGGAPEPSLTLPGSRFLNYTKVAIHFELLPIGAHKSGWQGTDPISFSLTGPGPFSEFLARLLSEVLLADNAPSARIIVDGSSKPLSAFADAATFLRLWSTATARLQPGPDVFVSPWDKEGEKVVHALRGEKFKGRKVKIHVFGDWEGGVGSENLTSVQDPGSSTETSLPGAVEGTLTLGPKTDFPTKSAFTLSPITLPLPIVRGSTITLPGLGDPAHMEWWHFQYKPGFNGKFWSEILGDVGWTREGLLGKEGSTPIFGHFGLGYLPKHLDAKAG